MLSLIFRSLIPLICFLQVGCGGGPKANPLIPLLCIGLVAFILLIIFAKHSQPLSGWNTLEGEDEDPPKPAAPITNAPVVLVEADTAGVPRAPDQVMVHVYHWTPSGYDYQGCVPLSRYAVEMPELQPRPGDFTSYPLPPAGECF